MVQTNIQYRGCLLWSSLPIFLKDCSTIQEFKRKNKKSGCDVSPRMSILREHLGRVIKFSNFLAYLSE